MIRHLGLVALALSCACKTRAAGPDTPGPYAAAVEAAVRGKDWPEVLLLLAAPPKAVENERDRLKAKARPTEVERAAIQILDAALDPRLPLADRLRAFKAAAPRAGPYACEARLFAYGAVQRAFDATTGAGAALLERQRALLSAVTGLDLPARGAAQILCDARYLKGCDSLGPMSAGAAYVRTLQAQLDAPLARGLKGCGPDHPWARALAPIVERKRLLEGLPIGADGRVDFADLGLKAMPMLDF